MKTCHLLAGFATAASVSLAAVSGGRAQETPSAAPPAGPTALSSPAMSATLSANPNPLSADVGFLGKIYFSGQVTGLATSETNPGFGDNAKGKVDFSNAQIEIQKTDGVV